MATLEGNRGRPIVCGHFYYPNFRALRYGTFVSLASFSKLTGSGDDDWVDRLNHIYTVVLLAIFSAFVTTKQLVGDPIHCWCPAQFTKTHISYAQSYCWVSNTYYVPMTNNIPDSIPTRENLELTYYQWVPVILLLMAMMFKLPCFIWRMLSGFSGVDLDKIVNMTMQSQLGGSQDRKKVVERIAVYLDRWLESNRAYKSNLLVRARQNLSRICCFFCGKREGTYLTGFYMFVKLLFIGNVVGQFFLLNAFLGDFYSVFGAEVIQDLVYSQSWKESSRFPRVTLCDFYIRQLTNVQRWTIQCVLPINLFNEKIFIFLWFWYFFVSAISCGNFLFWAWRTGFSKSRLLQVKKYLNIIDVIKTPRDKKLCQTFANDYLRNDGAFVLRIIGKNSTEILVTDLVSELWTIYLSKPVFRETIDLGDVGEQHTEV